MNNNTRQHKFVEKAPVITALIMSIVWFFFVQILMFVINYPISMFIEGYDHINGLIGLVIAVGLGLFIYKWWFRPEFEGMLKGNLPLGFLLGLTLMAYLVVACLPSIMMGGFTGFKSLSLEIIDISMTAGLCEELAFRGILISTLMRQWKNSEKFKTAIIISSCLFGLIHATNIFSGADLIGTIFQVISSVGIGMLLASVYLRSGTIVPCMFFHALYDIIVIWLSSDVSESGIIATTTLDWTQWYNLALCILIGIFALWFVRSAKYQDLKELWNRKWKSE